MAFRIFIDGGAGTTGLEIRQRLEGSPHYRCLVLDDARRKDPDARQAAMKESDVTILCLPDEAAREAGAWAQQIGARVIDASSAHRTAPGWTYGFPEIIGRETIASAARVSNPGCYPTGFLALLVPLLRAGLLSADWPYQLHAVSGYSGGGNALIDRFEADGSIAYRAYALALGHKHLAEMQAVAGLAHPPIFAPAVVPAYRGMIVEIGLPLAAMGAGSSPGQLREALREFYRECPLIWVAREDEMPGELLLRRDAAPSDRLELWVFANEQGSQARLIARLDNLGKGASGAAIQNLNLMCGINELEGLRLDR